MTGDNDDSDQPMKQWQVQPEGLPLSTPLRPNETSFNREDGILRVSSQFIQNHARDGLLTLQCLTATNIAANLQLELSKHTTSSYTLSKMFSGKLVFFNTFSTTPTLFFAAGLPSEIASSKDLISVCTSNLPTLPVSTLTVESGTSNRGTSYSYILLCGHSQGKNQEQKYCDWRHRQIQSFTTSYTHLHHYTAVAQLGPYTAIPFPRLNLLHTTNIPLYFFKVFVGE